MPDNPFTDNGGSGPYISCFTLRGRFYAAIPRRVWCQTSDGKWYSRRRNKTEQKAAKFSMSVLRQRALQHE